MSTWRPIHPLPFWKRWLPAWLHGPVKLLFQLSITGLIVGCGVAFFYFMLASRFDMEEVAKLPSGTVFLDRKGVEITAPGSVGRKLVKREDIPDFLVKSLRAREDARFFEHGGIDVRGLLRATLRNIKDRDFTQGASTLSMQLARNSFKMKQKSLHRKLLEIALTLRVEARYTKDEILTHYLNRIYFGAGADGIEQAAQTYFGKTTHDLSEGECAMIVGIIRGPHIFSPFRNLDAAIEQRNQTLNRLIAMGLIDTAHRDRIIAEPIKLMNEEEHETQTSYALQAVRRELDGILEDNDIHLGGLHVRTTLDAGWQNRLEIELTRAVEDLEHEKTWQHPTEAKHLAGTEPDYLQYAAVTTDLKTGATLALIGGRNYSDSRFDRTRSKRDLGSAFEPFVAAAAAERGKLVLPGRPVQTGRQIGPGEVERIAKRCGISGPFLQTEDLFRGSVSATPLEMSVGLATLGNKGKRPKPYLIQEIRDATGEVLYTAEPNLTAALGAAAASDAASVLQSSGGTRCFTGATGSERDAWTLRLGPSGATAIWLGFDKPAVIAPEPRLKALLDEFVKRLGNN
ncbi:MAG: transglycosylase domain-containing protein [Luteolibacter sp.]|uniref:transglycosylase domain-containing protein n=1 Tax=Luteolibacter sp. TaxID=1962973 RepID=UPI003267EEB3